MMRDKSVFTFFHAGTLQEKPEEKELEVCFSDVRLGELFFFLAVFCYAHL